MTAIPLTIRPAPWNQGAAYWVEQTQQHATTQELREQVQTGAARLFQIEAGGEIRGAFVVRVEQRQDGAEGVILSAAGHVPGVDLIAVMLEQIEGLFVNCKTYRLHTANPALARRVAAFGYGVTELVCTKEKHAKH